ncbi:MAG: YfhO family protein [Treponema sp.]|nr:YfhO family protein [Treponema sp.]
MKIKTSLALSFIFPFTIMGTAFALQGVFPFGSMQMVVGNSQEQYYPFLSNFWHSFREGSAAPWSWTAGAGFDYTAFFAYYLASPLNILAVLAPHAWLREVMALILLVKIGCAGLFTGLFLRYIVRYDNPQLKLSSDQLRVSIPVFSSFYALSAFTLGYYSHIIWFDSFALLPLVMLGLMALMNEEKYRLYVISLALAVFTNFLIGFYICIFIAITFFCQCIIRKYTHGYFLRKLGLLAAYSALAVGMTAVLLIPSSFALQNTFLQNSAPLSETFALHSFFDIIGNFIAFQPPTILHGLPNLYSGMITVLFTGLFFSSPKFAFREKIVLTGTFVFLLISCNINILEYMWNGFNILRGFPSRYSFLISFLLVVMAFRAFVSGDTIGRRSLFVMGISAALILPAAAFGSQEKTAVIGSTVLCVMYIMVLQFFKGKSTGRTQRLITAAFFLMMLTELSVSTWIGVGTNGTTDRDDFLDHYKQTQSLLELLEPAGDNFYRTDSYRMQTFNDPLLHHYNGITFYSSITTSNFAQFIQGLGLDIGENHYTYHETTPLFNAFLAMRYVMSLEGYHIGDNYWGLAGIAGNMLLLENHYYLPLGFMVNEELSAYKSQHDIPFSAQNDLFNKATGLEGSLFTVTNVTEAPPDRIHSSAGSSFLSWDYSVPFDGPLYICARRDYEFRIEIFVNDTFIGSMFIPEFGFYRLIGNFTHGDRITFSVPGEDPVLLYSGIFNENLFEQGYTRLASQPLTLTHFTNTLVKGHVTAYEDGLLYTSIPGDRNWSVYVNGVKSDIILIDNAMTAVHLSRGTHEVEFRYFNRSLLAGIFVSLTSLIIFTVFLIKSPFSPHPSTKKPSKHGKKRL